jgi:hypothetical protein
MASAAEAVTAPVTSGLFGGTASAAPKLVMLLKFIKH